MKSSLCLSAAAIALAWVLPAEAASSTSGPSVPLQQFAACAVQKYEGAEMLATQPGSDEQFEVLAEFARKGCTAPSSDMQTLRGALAEQLFKADFGAIGARPKRETIEVFTFDPGALAAMDPAEPKAGVPGLVRELRRSRGFNAFGRIASDRGRQCGRIKGHLRAPALLVALLERR